MFYGGHREANDWSFDPMNGSSYDHGSSFGDCVMVEIVRVSKDGFLLEIKEVSDKFRDIPCIEEEDD